MSKITDYAFLFQKSFGTSGVNAIGSFQLSQLNSSSVQSKLKAAGINTNSKQYILIHLSYSFFKILITYLFPLFFYRIK
jgi:hypothetical protein